MSTEGPMPPSRLTMRLFSRYRSSGMVFHMGVDEGRQTVQVACTSRSRPCQRHLSGLSDAESMT